MRYLEALQTVVKLCEIAQTECVANDYAKVQPVWNNKKSET